MKALKLSAPLLILVLGACQSFNAIVQEPKVSLNSVDIAGISLSGVDLVAHVNVENPNAFSVPLPTVDWELFINTASFIQGTLKKDQTIKSRGTITLDLPLRVTYDGLYTSFKSLINTKEAGYRIALGVSFPIPIIESKVYHLDFSGVLPLPQLPRLSPGQMRISKIDFSGLELACDINVQNPNVFPIPFPRLDWGYDVNDVPVVKGNLNGTGEIAAGAAAAAVVGVSIAYADIFQAVASAKTSGEAKSNLSLGFNPDNPGFPAAALADAAQGAKNLLSIPGTIPILQKPDVSFKGIAKKSLGTTMEFVLSWEVDNKNSFGFDIGEFNYGFKVNSNSWAQGRIDNPPQVKANGKTVIPVTVSVSALSIIKELVDVINRGSPVTYTCTGNMTLTSSLPGMDKLNLPLDLQGSTRIQ